MSYDDVLVIPPLTFFISLALMLFFLGLSALVLVLFLAALVVFGMIDRSPCPSRIYELFLIYSLGPQKTFFLATSVGRQPVLRSR